LLIETQQKGHLEVVNEAKKNLVLYFRNKERVVPASIKNNVIYQGDMEDSYQEIIRLYNMQGKMFEIIFLKIIIVIYYINLTFAH
jgi:hypothetical protein